MLSVRAALAFKILVVYMTDDMHGYDDCDVVTPLAAFFTNRSCFQDPVVHMADDMHSYVDGDLITT